VDVNFTSLLGADADAFIVQPTQLVFDSLDAQNITVSFGALPAVAGSHAVQEACCAGGVLRGWHTVREACCAGGVLCGRLAVGSL